MPDFKAYLRELLSSFLLTSEFKQAVVDNAAIDFANKITVQNDTIAPANGLYTAATTTTLNGMTAAFLYNYSEGNSSNILFGIRAFTSSAENSIYFTPVEKGRIIHYEGNHQDTVSLTFYPLKGAS